MFVKEIFVWFNSPLGNGTNDLISVYLRMGFQEVNMIVVFT